MVPRVNLAPSGVRRLPEPEDNDDTSIAREGLTH